MSRHFRERLGAGVLQAGPVSFGPIVPVILGENERSLEAARRLSSVGVLTQAIRPPSVPTGTARLRLTLSAAMCTRDVDRLADDLLVAVGVGAVKTEAEPKQLPAAPGRDFDQGITPRRRVVVLGTGTGVGKTWVSAALARALKRAAPGLPVLALKPIESGLGSSLVGADAKLLAEAVAGKPPAGARTFAEAVSPHLAAARARTRIDLDEVLEWVRSVEQGCHTSPYVVLESAGGVFSPLNERQTNFDLAQALEPATWVLVAPDSLGVLHDLTATLLAMRTLQRAPDHVVLSAARPADESTGHNAGELSQLGIANISAVFKNADENADALARVLIETLSRPGSAR